MSIVLQTFPASFGKPSASPFCTKVMCLLRMSGVEWSIDDKADVRKSPKKKFPVLLDGNEVIADSAAIADHLVARHGADFASGLSAAEQAHNHALVRMIEEHTYFAVMSDCWLVDSHWEKIRVAYFDKMTFGLRQMIAWIVRADIKRVCYGQGIARHSVQEKAARVQADLDSLAQALGDRPYFNSDTPTLADAAISPVLDGLITQHFLDGMVPHLDMPEVLQAYVTRCRESIFPSEELVKWRNS